MSLPIVVQSTKIYAFDDATPQALVANSNYHKVTITVQPLNITGGMDRPLEELLNETNAVPKANVTGSVILSATPPRSFEKYLIPEGAIDLATPSFISTTIPVWRVYPDFQTVTGCTHIALTITSYP